MAAVNRNQGRERIWKMQIGLKCPVATTQTCSKGNDDQIAMHLSITLRDFSFPGERYARSSSDKDIVIIVDINGFVAGIQGRVSPIFKNDSLFGFLMRFLKGHLHSHFLRLFLRPQWRRRPTSSFAFLAQSRT
jgi:hypothetical protein